MATPDEKYEMITRRLAEVFGGDTIKAILDKGNSPVAYWGACRAIDLFIEHLLIIHLFAGTAPTGRRKSYSCTD